ncbi:PREDICTED: CD59 glycoprotein-like isoform X1 [Poecilia mexicana]|uniref:CD59 glycoprotein-like isoform X1 n=1 Tax=Poecilia mexicana TaxID=48701 RepID=UPI00072DFD87|nr:PREDICTED: CD59 glycoprotein-like isoform X1 [Poecilia mexicana]
MMKLYGVLVLFVTFSVASGLRCYTCVTSDPNACTNVETCLDGFDRCSSLQIAGLIVKSCMPKAECISPIQCCDRDLCNGALLSGKGAILTGNSPILIGKGALLFSNGTLVTGKGAILTVKGAVLTGNGPVPTGPGVILLLLSSALKMLFI